jgi:prevent-host-death family protein
MKVAPVADVKAHLSKFITACQDEVVVVTRNGRPTAMLVGIHEDDDLEQMVLAQSPRFRRLLEQAARRANTEGIPHDEFWSELEAKPVAPPSVKGRKRRR